MTAREKVLDLDVLALKTVELKAQGKKIVHCHGVFDLLHLGHIRYFEAAKRYGDILVVTVTPDEFVNKGPSRPIFTHVHRAEAIAALAAVDFVAVNRWSTAVETIALLQPHAYVKGIEYQNAKNDVTGGITQEESAVRAVGGQIVFTDDITFSSSTLINRAFSSYPDATQQFLAGVGTRHGIAGVRKFLEGCRDLKVLVVGEAIIDEYVYCNTMGKSGKEPVLAALELRTERFAGGALAIANHVAALSDHVGVLSFLGAQEEHQRFVRERLAPSIQATFLPYEDSPTILKRRYVEFYPFQKLFETYVMGDELPMRNRMQLVTALLALLPKYDVVIVCDYGHGMFVPEAIEALVRDAKFLALNAQVNAHNRGFNTVSRYPKADFISLSEIELRLEERSRRGPLQPLVESLVSRVPTRTMIVTRGQEGTLCYGAEKEFLVAPPLALKVVDRVGAGDALFAISSLVVAQNAPLDIVGLLANAAGAHAVGVVGNREPLNRVTLTKFLEAILK